MAIQPTAPTPAPSPNPQRNDRATFSNRMDAFINWVTGIGTDFMALATNVYNNTLEAYNSAIAASASASSAAGFAHDAAASVVSAAQIAGTAKWISGTNYADGKAVWSPSSYLTYRKQSDGVSNIDPGIDVAGWKALSPSGGGAGGEVITGDITLTAGSAAAMVVAPIKHGHYALLPDCTTLHEGITQYAFCNLSDYAYGIKNKAGTILGWVPPWKGVSLLLADNTTAAGIWGGVGLDKIAVTSEFMPSNQQSNYGDVVKRLTLDSTRELFITAGTSFACVYDSSDNSYGALTFIGYLADNYFDAILASTDLVLIAHNTQLNPVQVKATTLSISGQTITVNSGGTQTYTGTYAAGFQSNLVSLNGSFVTGWSEGGYHKVMGISINGTTPSFGTPQAVGADGTAPYAPILFVTGTNLRALVYATGNVSCTPATISGNTLAMGTWAFTTATSFNTLRAFVNGNGNVVVEYVNSSLHAAIFRLTGTTEAVSALSLNINAPASMNYSCSFQISASKTLFVATTGGDLYVSIFVDTNGSASANYTGWGLGGATPQGIVPLIFSGDIARVACPTSSLVKVITVNCTGTSPTFAGVKSLPFAGGVGISYPQQSQDKFGNLNTSQLRTVTKDIFPREGYTAAMVLGVKDLQYLSSVNETCSIKGKTAGIGWLARKTLGNDGLAIRKIEVAE